MSTRIGLMLLCWCWALVVVAQEVVVEQIVVEGNQKTKERIVLRELDFEVGDTLLLAELEVRFAQNRQQLLNTRLFVEVQLEVIEQTIWVRLKENWYVYPIPIFEPINGYNTWIEDDKLSLGQVSYGLRLSWLNLTGSQDDLLIGFQDNFTRKFELRYKLPYLNRAQTTRLKVEALYSDNRDVQYTTLGNKVQFYRGIGKRRDAFRRLRFGMELEYRPKLLELHQFRLRYRRVAIADTIAVINPDFLLDGRTRQRSFQLYYAYRLNKRDNSLYAMNGAYYEVSVTKDGLGLFGELNALKINGLYEDYRSFSERLSLRTVVGGQLSLIREEQPFYNTLGIGDGGRYGPHYIQGYEHYVIDGTDFVYIRSALRQKVIDWKFDVGSLMPIKNYRLVELQVFPKIYGNWAYVHAPDYGEGNAFNNRPLWSWGVGIDILAYKSFLLELEYSVNHLGEGRFYFHKEFIF